MMPLPEKMLENIEVLHERVNNMQESCDENKKLAMTLTLWGGAILLSFLAWGALSIIELKQKQEVSDAHMLFVERAITEMQLDVKKLLDKSHP